MDACSARWVKRLLFLFRCFLDSLPIGRSSLTMSQDLAWPRSLLLASSLCFLSRFLFLLVLRLRLPLLPPGLPISFAPVSCMILPPACVFGFVFLLLLPVFSLTFLLLPPSRFLVTLPRTWQAKLDGIRWLVHGAPLEPQLCVESKLD